MIETGLNLFRWSSVILIPGYMIGWLMFVDTLGPLMHVYFLTTLMAFIFVASCSKKYYESDMRYILFTVYAVAILVTMPVIYQDATTSYGVDIMAIFMRSISVLILAVLAKEAIYSNVNNNA